MKYLILFSALFVAYFAKTFPPLEQSHSTSARVAQCILAAVIGAGLGLGWAWAWQDVMR